MNDENLNDENNPNMVPVEPAPVPTPWPADPGATQEAATAAPAPPGASPPAKPSWKTWVAVAATAAVVGAAAVFGISAATSSDSSDAATTQTGNGASALPNGGQDFQGGNGQGGPSFSGRPGGFGTISSIDGSTLTIKDQSGTSTKVLTSDSTTVTKSEDGSVEDIKVGDTVMVVGTGSSTNYAATTVTDDGKVTADENAPDAQGRFRNGPPEGMTGNGPPGGGAGQMPNGQMPNGQGPGGAGSNFQVTRGVVKSVGDGTFTVTGMNDEVVTVTTSSDTTVTVAKAATVSDLKVGDTVMVRGDESDGTITATSIRAGALGGPGGGPMGGPPGGATGGPPGAGSGSSSSDGSSQ